MQSSCGHLEGTTDPSNDVTLSAGQNGIKTEPGLNGCGPSYLSGDPTLNSHSVRRNGRRTRSAFAHGSHGSNTAWNGSYGIPSAREPAFRHAQTAAAARRNAPAASSRPTWTSCIIRTIRTAPTVDAVQVALMEMLREQCLLLHHKSSPLYRAEQLKAASRKASSSNLHTLELSDSCDAARNALTSALYSSPLPLAPSLQQPNHPHQPPPPYQQPTQPGSTPQPQTSPGPPHRNPHPAGVATPNSYMPSCDGRIPARTPSTV